MAAVAGHDKWGCDVKRDLGFLRYLIPVIVFVASIVLWEWRVQASGISPLVLATPSDIWTALFAHWDVLGPALLFTLKITGEAFVLATVAGVAIAVLFSLSRVVEWA